MLRPSHAVLSPISSYHGIGYESRASLEVDSLYADSASTSGSSRGCSEDSASFGYASGSSATDESAHLEQASASSTADDGNEEVQSALCRRRLRDPCDDRKYVICTVSRSGDAEVINHNRGRYDPSEPRASEATSSDYRKTRSRTTESKQARLHDRPKLSKLDGKRKDKGKSKEILLGDFSANMPPKPLLTATNKRGIAVAEPNEDLENSAPRVSDQLYKGTEQTDDDSSIFDELCDELEQLQIEGIALQNPVGNSRGHASIERFAQRFWDAFNRGWTTVPGSAEKESLSSPADTSVSSGDSSATLSTHGSRCLGRKRRRGTDEEKDGESEDDRRPRGKRPPGGKEPFYDIKFACPYRKHDTEKYCIFTHRLCVVSHWPTIPRLKEHLYRRHKTPIYCGRCKRTFDNEGEKREHEMAVDGCSPSREAPDGLTETQFKSLKRRTKNPLHKTEVDRWNGIYALLFPGEDIPSPYFEPAPEATQQPSYHRDLAGFKVHVRQEMDRYARTHLARLSKQRNQPFSNTDMENLITAFRSCQEDLLRSYSGRNSRSDTQTSASTSGGEVAGPSSSSPDVQRHAKIVKDSQYPTSENYLPDGSQLLAIPTVESQLDPSDYDYLDPPPEISSDPLWSDSGYGSMQFCTCPDACINHQFEAAYLGQHPKVDKGTEKDDPTEAPAEWEQWMAYDP